MNLAIFSKSVSADVLNWRNTLPAKSEFEVPEGLEDRVQFWIDIYSKYTTEQGVFHIVNHPEMILGEIDLTKIYDNSVLSSSAKEKKAKQLIDSERRKVLAKWKIKNPKTVRLQMGLKDRMEKALYLSGKYLPMMEDVFKRKKLPVELTRIVFVESSFNIFAQSKVGASGLWQIMPQTARPEGYIQKTFDKRNHPQYATQLAADILSQNHRSLKDWGLAITAYNHGLGGVRKMVRRAGTKDIVHLIDEAERTRTWGFASENFYACFLAVLEVERNALDLFGQNITRSKPLKTQQIYLKTAMTKKKVLKAFGGSLEKFRTYNPHIFLSKFNKNQKLPAGVPLILPAGVTML